jgi:hypothetical protein
MNSTSKTRLRVAWLSAAVLGVLASAMPASAQESGRKATHFLPVKNEAAPKLHVDPPLAEPLAARGTAVIPYRLENFRILPIFGTAAAAISPRAGHLHVTVDNLPWHWADAGNIDAVVVAGLSQGPHSVLIELATPEHQVITGQRVRFTIPAHRATHH